MALDPNALQAMRATLQALVQAVDAIDGQCIVCIEQFVKDANGELRRAGIPFGYRVLGWEECHGGPRVAVVDCQKENQA